MSHSKSSEDEQALTFAKAVARIARVNTAIHKCMQNAGADETISILEDEMYDADTMLATAEDDLRLGNLLFQSIEHVELEDHQIRQNRTCPTPSSVAGQVSRGIAKKPRHIKGQGDGGSELTMPIDPKIMEAAHVLRCSLQERFPLTWQKLLEDGREPGNL
ncbi:hypothetical protein CERZMDRAFT_102693 [Cercospora zeae-maydis SCOH1-5]|uniref:Uncharacterized protein n=1 Tax=Cercospora zeae-maydis SCOH1-5 TaxID=717836 RepID=A0A6A6EY73_9PEZI|nr:hypothetical protein CERZMDRAFT_102693 [Cercospora zeae-maydis SCOH1-5]